MNKTIMPILAFLTLFAFASCNNNDCYITVTVSNPLDFDRTDELVEVEMSDVADRLKLADTAQIVVLDEDGLQVPYQITYDDEVIFRATVEAKGTTVYTIQAGIPDPFEVAACGRYYPERMDDVAWENDLIGFRTYGPALQQSGNYGYGYDIFTKSGTFEPVLEERYEQALDPDKQAQIAELQKSDPKAAEEMARSISYHVDHGFGMDCYGVGPTLGAGTAALLNGDTLLYPLCYKTQEILDNGPLRFTVKLDYNPLVVHGDSNVVETRIISLDAGSYLNKTILSYTNLIEPLPLAVGIVLHEPNGAVVADAANGFMTYVDPTTDPQAGNGKIFVGAAFPTLLNQAKVVLFPEKEKAKQRGGADGHVLAISEYQPGSEYTYYWGAAWDKSAIKTSAEWNKYLSEYARKVRTPLIVTY